MRSIVGVTAVMVLGACGMSPLSNRLEIGKDPFVVFVGEGIDHNTDLFVIQTGGGTVLQLTFTPVVEASPRMVTDGSLVAFLRMRDTLPDTPREVVVMSLVGGGETRIAMPSDAGIPLNLAWSDDQQWLYVATATNLWRVATTESKPAVEPIAPSERATADSALERWVGQPRFARILPCGNGGVCLLGPTGDTTNVAPTGRDPFPWGRDSVAWFDNDELVVRSLGAGAPRQLSWKRPPQHPRDGSYAGQ